MKFILRNMWRRKARTFLTVFGIVVGIFALTVLGGLSARLTQQVNGAKAWYTSKISVVPPGSSIFGGENSYLELSKVQEIETVPGVKVAIAGIGVSLSQDSSGFSAPELMIGSDLRGAEDELNLIKLREGRILKDGDSRKVVLGSTLAEKNEVQVGDTIVLKDVPFEVAGIYQPTLSAPDGFAFVSYRDAMDIYLASSQFYQSEEVKGYVTGVLQDYVSDQQAAEVFQRIFPSIRGKDIAATIDVIPEAGVDMEELTQRIRDEVPDIRVISPKEAEKQISQFILIFNSILLRHRLHRPDRGRALHHQHHDHVGIRTHPGDRAEEGHRGGDPFHPRRVPAGVVDDRFLRGRYRHAAGAVDHLPAQPRL